MFAFQVNDMTCGHCVSTITKAVKGADKDATVQVDLARHRVEVGTETLDSDELAEVLRDAGYTPVAVRRAADAKPAKAGGCCGCCH